MVAEPQCPYCKERFVAKETPYVFNGKRYYHVECYKKRFPKDTDYVIVEPSKDNGVAATPKKEVKKEKVKKPNLKKCYYCGEEFDIDTEDFRKPVTNRYAHVKCWEENYTEDMVFIGEIYAYLKSLAIKYDFNQCERQRISYVKTKGYTNEGILYALKYFYDVKRQSPDRSGNRIGIVPYVYDEAQLYYEEMNKKKAKIGKDLSKQITKEAKEIKVKLKEVKQNRHYIDIDGLGD